MNYQGILEQIHHDLQPYLGTGRVADYIPELKRANPAHFGGAQGPDRGGARRVIRHGVRLRQFRTGTP